MRHLILASAFGLSLLAGCSPSATGGPGLAGNSILSPDPSVADICLAWRRALDGYDVAGERRQLADLLRRRGEDPSRCDRDRDGEDAVPLSPSAAATAPSVRRSGAPRPDPRAEARRSSRSTGRVPLKTALECISERVEGPPARYRTVCR